MNFFIKQNSILPLLRMKVIEDSNIDYQKFMTMLENSAITFSMRELNTGIYKIANKSGGILFEA